MMAAALLLTRYCILLPVYHAQDAPLQMPAAQFALLILATLLIGAGGYIVNDILDIAMDGTNKPGINTVGTDFPESSAWKVYYALSIAGVSLGTLVSLLAGKVELGILFLVIATALYYYSLKYKYLPFWGNLTVSLLTAMTVIIVWLFEFFHLKAAPATFVTISTSFGRINHLVFGYAFLAFSFSMIREIIKDTQDRIGDARFGCRTLPILLGEKRTRWLIFAMLAFSLVVLAVIQSVIFERYLFTSLTLGLVSLVAIYAMIRLASAKGEPDYGHLSLVSKVMLTGGLLSMIFFWFPNG